MSTSTKPLLLLLLLLLEVFLGGASHPAPSGEKESQRSRKILVVFESSDVKSTHSTYFDLLKASGYDLTFIQTGPKVVLSEHEEFNYGNLILFAPKANEFGGEATTLRILEFMKNGGNVVLAGTSSPGSAVRDLAYECGIDFDENQVVVDHFNVGSKDDGSHTMIKSSKVLASKAVFPDPITKPVLYKGAAHIVRENPLAFSLLTGNPTSFSAGLTSATTPFVMGQKTGLVSALQARNNARIVVSGSIDLFSNSFFIDESGDNKNFALSVTSWAFQERGILRVVSSSHHKVGEPAFPDHYIITDMMTFSAQIQEWTGEAWVPYVADDLQLEVQMLDPHIRTTLESDGQGGFSKTVKLPDVYGVFTFKIDYRRIGYSFVHVSYVVPVRPLRHNQYERFITSAYPYYGSALSMMIGFFCFSAVYLYSREKVKQH